MRTVGGLVGEDSSAADDEVVAAAICTLQAPGGKWCRSAVGQGGFLDGQFQGEVAGLPDAQEGLKSHLLNRDDVAFRATLRRLGLSAAQHNALHGPLPLRDAKGIAGQALELRSHPLARAYTEQHCHV
ncbi:hypothetical protein [Paenibacillus jilunlii]|uniref:hypothetical protein n=1 Tax=Paenibacillus jilunlii TaxID=682956 RepID=UPI0007838476|nr:hypothetical protein [Paenibacillus jilunlii]